MVHLQHYIFKYLKFKDKPAYGSEAGVVIEITSEFISGYSHYPRCNEIVCGVWPHIVSVGYLLKSEVQALGGDGAGEVEFPKTATIAASEECYQPYDYVMYKGFSSEVEAWSMADVGGRKYPICSSALRCSKHTYTTGGERDL